VSELASEGCVGNVTDARRESDFWGRPVEIIWVRGSSE
jgi:hypothetical protein